LVGFEKVKAELDALGVGVVAVSVDPPDKAAEVAAELSFAVAFGATRANADSIGAWWEDRRSIIQPATLVFDAAGKIIASNYSDGPIGRIEAADVVRFISYREAQLQKK
jgi:peroxiredoxin